MSKFVRRPNRHDSKRADNAVFLRALAELSRKRSRGQFENLFAHVLRGNGLRTDMALLEELGAVLESAFFDNGYPRTERAASSRLNSAARKFVKRFRGDEIPEGVQDFLDFFFSFQASTSFHDAERGWWPGRSSLETLAPMFSYIIGAAVSRRARRLPLDRGSLCEAALRMMRRDRAPGSITDVLRAYDTFTEDVPLTDWLPESHKPR